MEHFRKREYEKALRAFEHALLISNSSLVNTRIDTGLVYNTALAAFESKSWEKAIGYFTGLHEDRHAPSTSLLLYQSHLSAGDTASAEDVLLEAVKIYQYDEQLVSYLINHLTDNGRAELALEILEDAIAQRPDEYRFHWSKGLILQRLGRPEEAIESFLAATDLTGSEAKLFYHLGVIYYNLGVDLREKSMKIFDNAEYQQVKMASEERFAEAVKWLEKSYELDPSDEKTVSRLRQLYYQLQMKEKGESLSLQSSNP
jgi:tetratricopeptide (TPR) repeat protein